MAVKTGAMSEREFKLSDAETRSGLYEVQDNYMQSLNDIRRKLNLRDVGLDEEPHEGYSRRLSPQAIPKPPRHNLHVFGERKLASKSCTPNESSCTFNKSEIKFCLEATMKPPESDFFEPHLTVGSEFKLCARPLVEEIAKSHESIPQDQILQESLRYSYVFEDPNEQPPKHVEPVIKKPEDMNRVLPKKESNFKHILHEPQKDVDTRQNYNEREFESRMSIRSNLHVSRRETHVNLRSLLHMEDAEGPDLDPRELHLQLQRAQHERVVEGVIDPQQRLTPRTLEVPPKKLCLISSPLNKAALQESVSTNLNIDHLKTSPSPKLNAQKLKPPNPDFTAHDFKATGNTNSNAHDSIAATSANLNDHGFKASVSTDFKASGNRNSTADDSITPISTNLNALALKSSISTNLNDNDFKSSGSRRLSAYDSKASVSTNFNSYDFKASGNKNLNTQDSKASVTTNFDAHNLKASVNTYLKAHDFKASGSKHLIAHDLKTSVSTNFDAQDPKPSVNTYLNAHDIKVSKNRNLHMHDSKVSVSTNFDAHDLKAFVSTNFNTYDFKASGNRNLNIKEPKESISTNFNTHDLKASVSRNLHNHNFKASGNRNDSKASVSTNVDAHNLRPSVSTNKASENRNLNAHDSKESVGTNFDAHDFKTSVSTNMNTHDFKASGNKKIKTHDTKVSVSTDFEVHDVKASVSTNFSAHDFKDSGNRCFNFLKSKPSVSGNLNVKDLNTTNMHTDNVTNLKTPNLNLNATNLTTPNLNTININPDLLNPTCLNLHGSNAPYLKTYDSGRTHLKTVINSNTDNIKAVNFETANLNVDNLKQDSVKTSNLKASNLKATVFKVTDSKTYDFKASDFKAADCKTGFRTTNSNDTDLNAVVVKPYRSGFSSGSSSQSSRHSLGSQMRLLPFSGGHKLSKPRAKTAEPFRKSSVQTESSLGRLPLPSSTMDIREVSVVPEVRVITISDLDEENEETRMLNLVKKYYEATPTVSDISTPTTNFVSSYEVSEPSTQRSEISPRITIVETASEEEASNSKPESNLNFQLNTKLKQYLSDYSIRNSGALRTKMPVSKPGKMYSDYKVNAEKMLGSRSKKSKLSVVACSKTYNIPSGVEVNPYEKRGSSSARSRSLIFNRANQLTSLKYYEVSSSEEANHSDTNDLDRDKSKEKEKKSGIILAEESEEGEDSEGLCSRCFCWR